MDWLGLFPIGSALFPGLKIVENLDSEFMKQCTSGMVDIAVTMLLKLQPDSRRFSVGADQCRRDYHWGGNRLSLAITMGWW